MAIGTGTALAIGAGTGALTGYLGSREQRKQGKRDLAFQRKNSPFFLARPYLKEGFKGARSLYEGDPSTEYSADTRSAIDDLRRRAISGSPLMDMAQEQAYKTASGEYLGQNPYLEGQIQKAINPVANELKGAFSSSGRFGTGAMGDTMANRLGEISSDMAYRDYGAERGRMMGAIPMAQQLALSDYGDIDRLIQAGNYYDPGAALNRYLGRVQGLPSQSTPINPMYTNTSASVLGGGLAGLGGGIQLLNAFGGGTGGNSGIMGINPQQKPY